MGPVPYGPSRSWVVEASMRTRLLTVLVWIVAWGMGAALAAEGVPVARDLQQDAREARSRGAAVLVVFVASRCPYCELALNEVLIPTSRNPDYQRRLVMRRLDTRSTQPLLDFTGKRTTQREFAGRHGVHLVPTVMLFDPDGTPLTKPMVGITTVDQYSYDLDQAIDAAMARLQPRPAPSGGAPAES